MNRWIKVGILIVGLFLVTAVLGWLALPGIVNALPGSVRGRLPGEVIALVTTPLPTALPAPQVSSQSTPFEIIVPTLSSPTDTPAPTTAPETADLGPTPTLAASPTPSPEPTATPTKNPPPVSARINGMTVIPQGFNNCGPTNLAMTLDYYEVPHDQLEIAAVLKPNSDDRNVSPEELVRYVNDETTLRAAAYSGGDMELLKHLLAAGFPVIVEKGLVEDDDQGWIGHYVTLFGYDNGRQEFDTLDTFLGPWDSSGLPVAYPEMEEYWSHFNYTFVMVYEPGREAQLKEILGPQMVDPQLMWQTAALKAQEQLKSEPENPFIWFNLGTNLTNLAQITGDASYYQSAVAAFDRAREIGLPFRMLWYQFQPYPAYLAVGRYEDVAILTNAVLSTSGGLDVEETYLYQGRLRQAQGNIAGAVMAYREAVRLNPGFEEARTALEEAELE